MRALDEDASSCSEEEEDSSDEEEWGKEVAGLNLKQNKRRGSTHSMPYYMASLETYSCARTCYDEGQYALTTNWS